jgi:hypothetical protein
MEFQIKQNYGKGIAGWIYFKTDSTNIDELKNISIKEMVKDHNQIIPSQHLTPSKPASKTIEVCEYANGKKVKNGIKFKTKWR